MQKACRIFYEIFFTADKGVKDNMIVRQPAVANQFYSGNPASLVRDIEVMTGHGKGTETCIAVIAPHAGYIYSGPVAGAAYSRAVIPETVVIMGPNHTGRGAPASVMPDGTWHMPMGDVPVASDIAESLLQGSVYLEADYQAHMYEHSLEVQVPFLQYFQPGLEIVPVCLSHMSYEICEEIGRAVAAAIQASERPVLMVASTDMTHYEPQKQANIKDQAAIRQILNMDPAGLYDTVRINGISMCGVIPTTITMIAALTLGAARAELVKYATSGDVSGDYDRVVGYASFIIS